MHAPAFWWPMPPLLVARLLQPFGAVYGAITAQRMAGAGYRPARPVICVGNFTAGGAGKTPTAIALAERLRDMGHAPAFLTRGYGGRLRGPVLLGNGEEADDGFTHVDVGDEALLLARRAPVMVARDRRAGVEALVDAGVPVDVVIMDDGLQNPSLIKTLSFAVVDGQTGIGNGLCLPAGPLRAPLSRQLPHVDALIVIGEGAAGETVAHAAHALGKPVFAARLAPDPDAARLVRGERVLAFAGIGRPQKFFDMLEEIGAEVVVAKAFGDHVPFTPGQIAAIEDEALRDDLLPVTTEKDAVRFATLTVAPQLRASLAVVPVQIEFEDEEGLSAFLAAALAGAAPARSP
ncbi:tetraacyldisaccharide 4'-kinase [Pseudochelatococcus sp. B33]